MGDLKLSEPYKFIWCCTTDTRNGLQLACAQTLWTHNPPAIPNGVLKEKIPRIHLYF